MDNEPRSRSERWAGVALLLGGSLMAAMFVIFTYVHGPTSFDLDSPFLGKGTFFWGVMTSTPPSLLVALGLILLYPQLVQPGNRCPDHDTPTEWKSEENVFFQLTKYQRK